MPSPDERLQRELQASQAQGAELKEQLDKVSQALSEAQGALKERAENRRLVESAKATAAQLTVSHAYTPLSKMEAQRDVLHEGQYY